MAVALLTHAQCMRVHYGDDWTNRDGIAVVTCNDGFRPVTFLLEATNEEAGPFYQNEEKKD